MCKFQVLGLQNGGLEWSRAIFIPPVKQEKNNLSDYSSKQV